MLNNFICSGCDNGPCHTNESAVRPVIIRCYPSYKPNSDLWKYYRGIKDYQCMNVINRRNDVFQCDECGFLLEEHMLHIIQGENNSDIHVCPDCYAQYHGGIVCD